MEQRNESSLRTTYLLLSFLTSFLLAAKLALEVRMAGRDVAGWLAGREGSGQAQGRGGGAAPRWRSRATASTTTRRPALSLPLSLQVHGSRTPEPLTLVVEVEVGDGPRQGGPQQPAALVTQRSIAGAARGSSASGQPPAASAAKHPTRVVAVAAGQGPEEVTDVPAAPEQQAQPAGGGHYLLPLAGPDSHTGQH